MHIPHSKPCLGQEERAAVDHVLASGMLAQGAQVQAFEAECAALVGRQYGIAVSSGTAALHLALAVLGIGPKNTVGMPAYVCAALPQAATAQRARPVLADIGADYNLLPNALPQDTSLAIVPHLFGGRAALPPGKPVIEDIAQSIGGPTGRDGDITVASFYATKMLTTGEGGMLLTDDENLAASARDRRDYDNRPDFIPRFAYKMTDFQAAIGRAQLKRLHGFIHRRRAIAAQYNDAFQGLPLTPPKGKDHVFFRYVIATSARDALMAHLREAGIDAKPPVYRPLHHWFGGTFPMAERAHNEALSLPLYPALLPKEVESVVESLHRFYS